MCVAADERRGEAPGALQPGVLLGGAGRLRQPPVPVQLGLHLAGRRVGPLAAAGDDHGRRADQPSQKRQPGLGVGVDLDGQGEPVGEVLFAGVVGVVERADRRREHHRLLGAAPPGWPAPKAIWTSGASPAPLISTPRISNGGSPALWVKVRRLAKVPSSACLNIALTKRAISARSAATAVKPRLHWQTLSASASGIR